MSAPARTSGAGAGARRREWPPLPARPRVAVVTLFSDNAYRVDPSLPSLLSQTYPDLEVVAVDDGSRDDTWERLSAYAGDPRLTLRRHPNLGLVRALRAAIEETDSDVVAIHGSGDVSEPERIARQVELLADPSVGLVGCHVAQVHERAGVVGSKGDVVEPDTTAQLLRHNLFTHGEVLYRRDVYEAVGGYRTIFRYAQDRDLWLRMSAVTRVASVPEVLYRRYLRPDGVSTAPEKLLLQRHLSAFAVQCMRMRLRFGYDWVDLYGDDAGLFAAPSPVVAAELVPLALKALEDGDPERAVLLASLSRQHRDRPGTRVVERVLGTADRRPAVAAALQRAIAVRRRRQGRLTAADRAAATARSSQETGDDTRRAA